MDLLKHVQRTDMVFTRKDGIFMGELLVSGRVRDYDYEAPAIRPFLLAGLLGPAISSDGGVVGIEGEPP